MADKIATNVGMYVAFLDRGVDGKLLLRKREEEHSIVEKTSFTGCYELPGKAMDDECAVVGYNNPIDVAFIGAEQKIGIQIPIDQRPFTGPVHLAFFKNGDKYDTGMVIPFVTRIKPTKGTTIYVSPQELEVLAIEFINATAARAQGGVEGKGLLSGKGKRMHCLALAALAYSPNQVFANEARQMLAEIAKQAP